MTSKVKTLAATALLALVGVAGIGALPLVAQAQSSPGTAHAARVHHGSHSHHRKQRRHRVGHRRHGGIPQHNGGDHDPDNNGGPSDGDGNV